MHLRREAVKGKDTVYVQLEDKEWHHSIFPHELLILDYDEASQLIGLEIVGSAARNVIETIVKDANDE